MVVRVLLRELEVSLKGCIPAGSIPPSAPECVRLPKRTLDRVPPRTPADAGSTDKEQ